MTGGGARDPAWWRGYRPTERAPEWRPPGTVTLTGEVTRVDLSEAPLDDTMLRHVDFAHAEVRGVELALDEVRMSAYWSTFEDCVLRQRSRRLHPEGWEPGGLLAWRPTVYRRCRFVGLRFRRNNGVDMARARFEDCVFERCTWNVNIVETDMLRCRIVGPMASVVFFGWSRGADDRWRRNEWVDNDFTDAVIPERNIDFLYDFPVDQQRWPAGYSPISEPLPPEATEERDPGLGVPAANPVRVLPPRVQVSSPTRIGAGRRHSSLPDARPRSLVMAVDELPIPSGHSSGYGASLCALGDGSVTTTWVVGVQAQRLARIDPITGEATVVKGVRGDLRAVVTDPDGDRAWLLTTHALHEVGLAPFRIRRTLGRPLGTYQDTAIRLDDQTLLVARSTGRVAQLVSTTSMQVTGRINVPAPQLALHTTAGTRLYGFGARYARALTDQHRPKGRPTPLPLGCDPIATGPMIAFLPAAATPRFETQPAAEHEDLSTRAEPVGRVAFLDPATLQVDDTGPDLGIGSLHGLDTANRLIASDHGHDPEPGTTLAVLDHTAHHVEGVLRLPGRLDAIAPITGLGAVVRPHSTGRTPGRLWVTRWDNPS